jgi:hypothetical protein
MRSPYRAQASAGRSRPLAVRLACLVELARHIRGSLSDACLNYVSDTETPKGHHPDQEIFSGCEAG